MHVRGRKGAVRTAVYSVVYGVWKWREHVRRKAPKRTTQHQTHEVRLFHIKIYKLYMRCARMCLYIDYIIGVYSRMNLRTRCIVLPCWRAYIILRIFSTLNNIIYKYTLLIDGVLTPNSRLHTSCGQIVNDINSDTTILRTRVVLSTYLQLRTSRKWKPRKLGTQLLC